MKNCYFKLLSFEWINSTFKLKIVLICNPPLLATTSSMGCVSTCTGTSTTHECNHLWQWLVSVPIIIWCCHDEQLHLCNQRASDCKCRCSCSRRSNSNISNNSNINNISSSSNNNISSKSCRNNIIISIAAAVVAVTASASAAAVTTSKTAAGLRDGVAAQTAMDHLPGCPVATTTTAAAAAAAAAAAVATSSTATAWATLHCCYCWCIGCFCCHWYWTVPLQLTSQQVFFAALAQDLLPVPQNRS